MKRRTDTSNAPAELTRFDPHEWDSADAWYAARAAWSEAHPEQALPAPSSLPDGLVDWEALGFPSGAGHYVFGVRAR
ncbi:hypothetical protein [Catellatospora methionotrophica]|uniref:hypothetical protein n=1 Tax=Catellatospora methionotrophica TaxID=121620 RepID=UPI0033D5B944